MESFTCFPPQKDITSDMLLDQDKNYIRKSKVSFGNETSET